MVLMAERVTQALARNPKLFRPGRGQLTDFANRYGMMLTTAKRIVSASTFPPYVLLPALSQDVKVPIDWFFGMGHFDSIDETLANANVQIPVFGHPERATIDVPPWGLLSYPEGAQLVAVPVDSNDFIPRLHSGDFALIQVSDTPQLRELSGVAFSGSSTARLAFITGSLRKDKYTATADGRTKEEFMAKQVSFGGKKAPKGGMQVIGPVRGRVCFDANRPILLPGMEA